MRFWSGRAEATCAAAALPDHLLNGQIHHARGAAGRSSSSLGSANAAPLLVPVVAVARPTRDGFGPGAGGRAGVHAGWDLVVPAGWGRAFWVALAMAGAHAGGEDERHAVNSLFLSEALAPSPPPLYLLPNLPCS